jgi:hypothetical protein
MKAVMKLGIVGAAAILAVAGMWYAKPLLAEPAYIDIAVDDDSPYHVFPPGQGFSITVTPTVRSGAVPDDLGYEWVDFRGKPLTAPSPLVPNKRQTIPSPSPDMAVGYYGLKLLPADGSVAFNPNSGLRPEIGFAVLPAAEKHGPDPESRFGIVHFDATDPYLDPGWMKTLTDVQAGWNGQTLDHGKWRSLIIARRDHGQVELPLIMGENWKSGTPVQIAGMMATLFRADPGFDGKPDVPVYELGLEENLNSDDFVKSLAGTAKKFRAVQAEKARLAPSVKLAYQVAGTDISPYRTLFESPLGKEIDILAAHPYRWHGWPSPDDWHDGFVDQIRAAMAANGVTVPIWYTEVGAVQNDADVQIIFSGARPTGHGLSRAGYAAYLIKLHAHAFAKGVEKVFWYNYRDRTTSTTDAEAHFGLRDYWGYPKPGYLAYAATLRCMKGRTASAAPAADGIMRYVFAGADGDCLVAWNTSDQIRAISVTELLNGKSADQVAEAFDTVGTPIPVSAGTVPVGPYPVFLIVRKAH